MPETDTELICAAIHSRIAEMFPDKEDGAYCGFDYKYTIIRVPDVKIFYHDDSANVLCWITGEGGASRRLLIEYADPTMMDQLEEALKDWYRTEIRQSSRFQFQPGPRTNW